MLKWLLVLAIVVFLLGLLQPRQSSEAHRPTVDGHHIASSGRKGNAWRPGRLPGDLHWHFRGKEYYFPFTSTLLISLLIALLGRFL